MNRNNKLLTSLVMTTLLMFGFGFALVPLYDVFCDLTGLNGKVSGVASNSLFLKDLDRTIKVQFVTNRNEQMPWEFSAYQSDVLANPGVDMKAVFKVSNTTNSSMVGQAVPSISPSRAAQYFKKTQCFCFNNQRLEANESVDMTVLFTIDPALPKDITKLTLSYTFFDVTPS